MKRNALFQKWAVFLVVAFPVFLFSEVKIGYVDSDQILSTYTEAVDVLKKLESENNKWGQELKQMTDELGNMRNEIEQQSLLLSDAKKKEKLQELENKRLLVQKYQIEKWGENGEYFRRRENLLKPIFDKINTAIASLGEEEKYDFIFDSMQGNLLFSQDKYDLTDEVLEELERLSAEAGSK